jgi:hypothetical protein
VKSALRIQSTVARHLEDKRRPQSWVQRRNGHHDRKLSGRKNGSARVKQKNGRKSRFRAKILSSLSESRHQFSWHKNRNNCGFPHQIP